MSAEAIFTIKVILVMAALVVLGDVMLVHLHVFGSWLFVPLGLIAGRMARREHR